MTQVVDKWSNATLGLPARVLEQSEMPATIAIEQEGRQVGAILVLLDGILVATRDPALGAAWRARLTSNEEHFNIRPKMRESGHSRDRDSQAPLEFAGVSFAKEGFRPRSQLDPEAPQPRAGPTRLCDLASRLGPILWHLRVHSALAPASGPLQHELLMQLYSKVGKEGVGADFAEQSVELSERDAGVLSRLSRMAREQGPTAWPEQDTAALPVIMLATDAFPRGLGYVVYDPDGKPRAQRHVSIEETDQVIAEAMAVAWACRDVALNLGDRVQQVQVVVAVDADTVRSTINKAYSRTTALRTQLRRVFAATPHVSAVRVAGEQNAADAPSRGAALRAEHVAATWTVLQAATAGRTPYLGGEPWQCDTSDPARGPLRQAVE